MANKTPNIGLTKPEPTDFYDVNVHNDNMDKIDAELSKLNVFKVTFSYDGNKRKYVSDKSYNEIISALDSGKTVVGYYDEGSEGRYVLSNCTFFPAISGSYSNHVKFSTTNTRRGGIMINSIALDENDEIEYEYGIASICNYSTIDLTAGSSALKSGTLYLVYE